MPPTLPSILRRVVVRLPVPVAALAKRLADKSLRAGDIMRFSISHLSGPLPCR